MGFRDDFDAKMEDMVEHICAMEEKIDTTESLELIKEIREYARNTTYMYVDSGISVQFVELM